MRLTLEHIAHMRAAITPLDTEETRESYRAFKIDRADLVSNLDKRYRWDLFHAAKLGGWACNVVYPTGANDTHMDTALRAIVPSL